MGETYLGIQVKREKEKREKKNSESSFFAALEKETRISNLFLSLTKKKKKQVYRFSTSAAPPAPPRSPSRPTRPTRGTRSKRARRGTTSLGAIRRTEKEAEEGVKEMEVEVELAMKQKIQAEERQQLPTHPPSSLPAQSPGTPWRPSRPGLSSRGARWRRWMPWTNCELSTLVRSE